MNDIKTLARIFEPALCRIRDKCDMAVNECRSIEFIYDSKIFKCIYDNCELKSIEECDMKKTSQHEEYQNLQSAEGTPQEFDVGVDNTVTMCNDRNRFANAQFKYFRDEIAISAMQGMLAVGLPLEKPILATHAYQYADAMLEARGR